MDIQKTTAKIMLNAIENFSKEYQVAETEIQLMISIR